MSYVEEPDQGFYALGFSVDGLPWGELSLDSVSVTRSLNEPSTASLSVLVDSRWGVSGDDTGFHRLRPWGGCVGVFDAASDELLFYGPVVKRRRQALSTGMGLIQLECKSWDHWLGLVYPELNWFADGSSAESESATRAVKEIMWGVFSQDGAGDWVGGTGSEEQMRASVAGRAGKHFGFMPIIGPVFDLAAEKPVYLSWDTVSPGSVAQTSALKLVGEVTDQGVDAWCDTSYAPGDDKAVTRYRMRAAPVWTTPPPPVVTLVVAGDVSEATIVDRGDLSASVVHVSGGTGQSAEYPAWSTAQPAALLLERRHPYQRHDSGTPISEAALQARGKQLLGMLQPAPREATDLRVHYRLATLRPGDVIQLEVPKGIDPADRAEGWAMLGRVASVTWGGDIPGCEVTFFEPGDTAGVDSGVAAVIPAKSDFLGGVSATADTVTSLSMG